MRELNMQEVESVNGGVPLLAPVAVALADTGGWAAVASAATFGYQVGTWYNSLGGSGMTGGPSYMSGSGYSTAYGGA